MQEDDGITRPRVDGRHLAVEDPDTPALVRII